MDTLIRETKPKPGQLPEIIPAQYWDPDSDDGNGAYEKIRGTRGAPRVLLWGVDGAPLLTEEYPGHMDMIDRAARLLGKVSADDGSLVTLGAIADAVVAAGATGTLSAKLRRLTTDLDALLTKVGEIQASPTANTILARLKDIKDGIPLTGSSVVVGKVGIDQTTDGTTNKVSAENKVSNGTTLDTWRNNVQKTLLASAARTTATTSPVQDNYNARGVVLTLNVTANPGGAETLELRLYYRVGVTGGLFAKMAIPAATNATYSLIVCPGSSGTPETAAAYKTYSLAIPRQYVANVTPSGAGSWTYELTATEIV